MTSNASMTISSIEEESIDRDRIFNGDLVPDEYFCPICQYLLWKPRSCSSCQHLFCEKCIRMWSENSNNENKCPFRCQPFEERSCPPYLQSLLSHLNIHCRNSSFGCREVLSYDALEHHENVQCQYLTQRCLECEKLVLISLLDEHRQIPGFCVPQPIKCTICQNHIEKSAFREHFHECCQKRINELNQLASLRQNLQTLLNDQGITRPNPAMTFFQTVTNTMQLVEQQKQMSRLPTSLKGVNMIRRAREQNCGHLYHILIMLKFILLNWSKIPFFLYVLSIGGLFSVGILILGGYVIFSHWAYRHIYYGPCFIILLSYLLGYGTSVFFQYASDATIILPVAIFIFLCGCTSRASLEVLEMDYLFNRTVLSVVLYCVAILIMKIILLSIRFYYSFMPIYVAAGLLTCLNFYLSFKAHLVYANAIATTMNQPMLPV
ncbi:unnamed protein product [Rotaria sp. Silwood2]|nr:unnamed protein product [Rotaria sp. Silwood2]